LVWQIVYKSRFLGDANGKIQTPKKSRQQKEKSPLEGAAQDYRLRLKLPDLPAGLV
jgi:hypothetical protein